VLAQSNDVEAVQGNVSDWLAAAESYCSKSLWRDGNVPYRGDRFLECRL